MHRKRCDARTKNIIRKMPNGRVRISARCRAWVMIGKTRCRMHGGASTGPRTDEGKARAVVAMVAGRHNWVERMKAERKKFPCGRKSGDAWITPAMRAREAASQRESAANRPPAPLDAGSLEVIRAVAKVRIDKLLAQVRRE